MARSCTRCAIPTSGRRRPAIPAIWASSCATCPTCRRPCARSPASENSIERWWQQLEAAQKHPDGSFKVFNVLAMAASYDPDPTQFLGMRLPVTFDTCEVIEERWANWLRHDPVVAVETQADNLRRLKALYIDCGERDQFNLLYGARRFVRRLKRTRHRASLRGVRRQPYRRRLPDGREPAVSRRGAVRLRWQQRAGRR